jgi:hypothetical protein
LVRPNTSEVALKKTKPKETMVGVVPRNPEIERLILSSLKDKILSVL